MGGSDELDRKAAKAWNLSCPDWQERLRSGRPLVPDLPLWEDEATRAVSIFNNLRLPDVAGKPELKVAAGDWFRDSLIRPVFGSLNPTTNERVIREFFCLAPKKSSKTSYGAGLMLTALVMNSRPRAEFLLIAPSKLIAQIAYDQISGMIEADEEGILQARFHVQDYIKTIEDRRNGATLVIKAFDSSVLTGVKPVAVLIDELHEISKDASAQRIMRQLRGGLMPNPEGFLLFITTQSDTTPSGVFAAELKTARAVRDGLSDYPVLPILYEFPDDIASDETKWSDPKIWSWVNPNIGRPHTVGRLHEDYLKAKNDGLTDLIIWASQHLNIEVGKGITFGSWAGAEFWSQNAAPVLDVDAILDQCEVVVVGIDGGGLDDLLGLAVLGRSRTNRQWLLWTHGWAHRIVLQRRKEIAARLLDFEKDGSLTIVDSPGDDVADVVEIVSKIDKRGLLPEKAAIGVDAIGIGDIIYALSAQGFSTDRIVGISQGYKLNAAIKTTERKLAGGELVHSDSPLMNWCIGNAKVEPKGNAVSITKQASGWAKIDPVMATFDAVFLMALNPEPSRRGRARALIL